MLGGSGQVGVGLASSLRAAGHEAVVTYYRTPVPGGVPLDITDGRAVGELTRAVRPDWVLCPAALASVDHCERDPDLAWRVNVVGPLAAATAANDQKASFVYYSSEYVFDGSEGPYGEDDPPNPLGVYGRTKLAAERGIPERAESYLVLRTTVVYGPDPQEKNFVFQVLRALRAGRRMRVPLDQVSSPTYGPDLARASVRLLELGCRGTYHVAGPEVCDRYTFARLIGETFRLDVSLLEAVPTATLGQTARRPLQGGLKTEKLEAFLPGLMRTPSQGVAALKQGLRLETGRTAGKGEDE